MSAEPAVMSDFAPEVTEAAQLLDDLAKFLRRFVVLTKTESAAIALWIAHSHAFEAADCTPYLSIRSAEKRSGKTRLLEVLELLAREPLLAASMTDAALFRSVSADPTPTLLWDEIDAVFGAKARDREDLRGLLNAGYRRGATVRRMGGKQMTELHTFSVFCPKAFSGIGALPDTLEDRAIRISLKRRTRDEKVERFRRRDAEETAEPLQISLASWADHVSPHLHEARPTLPDELDDRAQDCWEPLLAIADLAGGQWPTRARAAAIVLSGSTQEDDSLTARLLADIQQVFEHGGIDRVHSGDLVSELLKIEESPWADLYGKGMTAHRLAHLLHSYAISPHPIRIAEKQARGYKKEQFEDAFLRYLPQPPLQSVTPTQPQESSGFEGDFAPSQENLSDVPINGEIPLYDNDCDGVTLQVPEIEPLPAFGDSGYLDFVAATHTNGHITTKEALQLEQLHELVRRAA